MIEKNEKEYWTDYIYIQEENICFSHVWNNFQLILKTYLISIWQIYSESKNDWSTYIFDFFLAMINFETELSSDSDSPRNSQPDAFCIKILSMENGKKPSLFSCSKAFPVKNMHKKNGRKRVLKNMETCLSVKKGVL